MVQDRKGQKKGRGQTHESEGTGNEDTKHTKHMDNDTYTDTITQAHTDTNTNRYKHAPENETEDDGGKGREGVSERRGEEEGTGGRREVVAVYHVGGRKEWWTRGGGGGRGDPLPVIPSITAVQFTFFLLRSILGLHFEKTLALYQIRISKSIGRHLISEIRSDIKHCCPPSLQFTLIPTSSRQKP